MLGSKHLSKFRDMVSQKYIDDYLHRR